VKHTLQCLKQTVDYSLVYEKTGMRVMVVSADWGGGKDRKSTSGYVVLGCEAVVRRSRKHKNISTSTAEAE